MITMAAFAIIGAALGLFVRPRLLGVALAVLLAAIVEGGAYWAIGVMVHQTNREVLVMRLREVFGEDLIGMVVPVVATAMGGLVSALLGFFTDPKKAGPMLTADNIQRVAGKNGRYARAAGMVQERAIHAKAESRIDQILGL